MKRCSECGCAAGHMTGCPESDDEDNETELQESDEVEIEIVQPQFDPQEKLLAERSWHAENSKQNE